MCYRRLTHERSQCRAALSDKDMKLAEIKQQLTAANTQIDQTAAQVAHNNNNNNNNNNI